MVSRAELLRQNAEKSKYNTNQKNKGKPIRKGKRNNKRYKKEDEMDKFINKIRTFKTLKNIRTEEITTSEDEWSIFVAQYFKEKLNTNQLRDIHYEFKKIEQLEDNWESRKFNYKIIEMNIQLKQEKNVIPKKFYELMNSLFRIVNKSDVEEKNINLNKIIVFMDSLVGYHKYYEKNHKVDKTLNEQISKINNQYLLEISENDGYVNDTDKISNILYLKGKEITVYQIRKIFNVFKDMERRINDDWKNIEEEYYKFYPKLAYIAGRGLITEEYYILIKKSMDVINQGTDKEKIIKLKNFIKYLEAIISYVTYQNKIKTWREKYV